MKKERTQHSSQNIFKKIIHFFKSKPDLDNDDQQIKLNPANLNSEKIVSHKYKFVFLSVPKAATRSLITALYRKPVQDFRAEEYKLSTADLFNQYPQVKDYYKFTFVRNPWSRVVSTYNNKINSSDENVKKMIIDQFPSLQTGMPFDAFVDFLMSPEGSDQVADRHWVSQYKLLYNKNNELDLDYIGKMETIETDLEEICKNLNIPAIIIPNLNTRSGWTSERKKENLIYHRQYYSEDTKNLIAERYKDDIELFDYHF